MSFERIRLNVIPDGDMPVFHVSQFDVGRPIIIDLYNGDDAYTPAEGVTFELHCRKVDDNIVTLTTYEVDQNTLTFASTEQLCACSGDNLCEIAILLDDLVMGTLNFILHVERDPLAGGCTSETSIYNLQQQIDDIITGEGYVKDTDLNILQSDWNEEDNTKPSYIKNKPSGTLQVQSDWTEADTTSPAYIKHKPEIPEAQVQSDWTEADNTKVDFIKNKPDLSIYAQSSDLASVATSGDYDDLINKPTIPAAQVNSDWNSNSGVSQILNKPWVPVYTENETPYQIRTAPAGNNRCLEKLIGVSCAFNQLVQNGNFVDVSGWINNNATLSVNNNIGEVTLTSADGYILNSINLLSGHKYLRIVDIKGVSGITYGFNGEFNAHSGTGDWATISNIFNSTSTSTHYLVIQSNENSDFQPFYLRNCMYIDLTACFGSEVADYFYTLESITAGSGIALFRQLFPESYYVYQTASLESSKPVSKKIYDSDNNVIATYPLGGDELRGLLKVVDGQLVAYGDVKGSDGIIYRYFEERAYASGDESLPNAITDGTNTVVKLATPTTASGTPFSNPMISGSTEEFTDSRSLKMFCGHDSLYYSSPFKGW